MTGSSLAWHLLLGNDWLSVLNKTIFFLFFVRQAKKLFWLYSVYVAIDVKSTTNSEGLETMNVLRIWLHVQSVLLGIILLASLFLNGLLMKVLWMKMKSKRCKGDATSNNIERIYTYLLYHLAFSDILSVLLNIPFDIFLHTEVVVIYVSHIGCQILPPFQLASTTAQAGTYVALSYHRFRAIVHPFSATVTGYKSFIMITLIWFFSVGLSIPFAMVNRFNATSSKCCENWGRKSKTLYTFSIFIVQYGFPVSLMALFYIAIARTLQK